MKSKISHWMPGTRCMLTIACIGWFMPAAMGAMGRSNASSNPPIHDRVTHIHMQSVLFRVMKSVVLQVDSLDGELAPTQRNEVISLDDKKSFYLKIQSATASMSSSDLAALVNDFILPRAKTPLRNLSLTFNPDQSIQVKGDFHKLVDVPFSGTATLRVTPDGNMRMHLANMTVAGVIHQDVLNFLGIKVSSVAQPKRKQSFKIVGNDIIFPIDQMFPPPHVRGRLHDINISGDRLNLVFESDAKRSDARRSGVETPTVASGSFIFFRGGTMRFALLTMRPVDLELVPLKPDHHKSFEFSVDQYYQQLVGGYSKSLPDKGLLVYMADDRDLQAAAQPTQK